MSLAYSASQEKQSTILRFEGSIDALTASEAQKYLESHINEGQAKLILDLSALEYISSAGLRALLGALKAARAVGGDMRLAALNSSIHKMLSMAGFTDIAKTFATLDDARASYE